MIYSNIDGRLADSPSLEEVRSSEFENIWASCGVSCQVNNLCSVFLKVDFDFEFWCKQVLVLLVNKNLNFVVPGVECSIRIFLSEEFVDLGAFNTRNNKVKI